MRYSKQTIIALAAGTVFIMGTALPKQAFAQDEAAQGIKNVLLVHGAWANGSSWSKVIPLLAANGLNVVAVELPLTSLADDVATTERALALETGPVLLVGHSYAGAVITEAGNDPKVASLMYVAAYAPDEGESCLSLANAYPTPVGAELRPDASMSFFKLSVKGILEDFAQDLPELERWTLFVTQGPTGAAALGAPIFGSGVEEQTRLVHRCRARPYHFASAGGNGSVANECNDNHSEHQPRCNAFRSNPGRRFHYPSRSTSREGFEMTSASS